MQCYRGGMHFALKQPSGLRLLGTAASVRTMHRRDLFISAHYTHVLNRCIADDIRKRCT